MAASDMPSPALIQRRPIPGEKRAGVERGRSVLWVEPQAEVEVQYNSSCNGTPRRLCAFAGERTEEAVDPDDWEKPMPTINFTLDDSAYTLVRDTSKSLSVEAEKAVHAATRLTQEKPVPQVTHEFSCTDMVANEIRKHFEKLEQQYNAEHNREKGRTSNLAAVAVAQGLTRGLSMKRL
jgi:hypothetical protein